MQKDAVKVYCWMSIHRGEGGEGGEGGRGQYIFAEDKDQVAHGFLFSTVVGILFGVRGAVPLEDGSGILSQQLIFLALCYGYRLPLG